MTRKRWHTQGLTGIVQKVPAVQSGLYKASEPQEIVSLVRVIQSVGHTGEWMTDSKPEEMHSVEQAKRICEVLCLRPISGL